MRYEQPSILFRFWTSTLWEFQVSFVFPRRAPRKGNLEAPTVRKSEDPIVRPHGSVSLRGDSFLIYRPYTPATPDTIHKPDCTNVTQWLPTYHINGTSRIHPMAFSQSLQFYLKSKYEYSVPFRAPNSWAKEAIPGASSNISLNSNIAELSCDEPTHF